MAKGLLVHKPYRKQSHDCSGVILFRNDDNTNCYHCHLGCHCNPRGHLRHFSITGTQLPLLPEVRTPPPSPAANRYTYLRSGRVKESRCHLFSFFLQQQSQVKPGFPGPGLCSCLQTPHHISRRGAAEAEKAEGFSEVPGSGQQQLSNFLASCGANLKASGGPLVFHPSSLSIALQVLYSL